MSILALGPADLFFETRGAGEAVVLVHGFALDGRIWDSQAAALEPTYRVVVPDLRGFGRSSPPSGPFLHIADLSALLDHLEVDSAHLVGLSLGGAVALDFCLAQPGRVRTLTLADAAMGGFDWSKDWGRPGRAARAQGLPAGRRAWLSDELLAPALRLPEPAARLRQMVEGYSGWHWLNRSPEQTPAGAPASQRLAEVQAPTLVIVGEADAPDFLQIADRLANGIRGARLAVVAGAGHLSNLEAPEQFNALLLEFLRRPGPPQGG